MKSRFVPKRDEVVLSTMTAVIACGLVYLGLASLATGREHTIFQKSPAVTSKK
jgi:hypothetical protein